MSSAPPQLTLPNGLTVTCLNKREADYIYREIPTYFQCGIQLAKGDTVFDVGANIGLFSLSVYERCGQDVNIYAFEPIPPIYEVLEQNKNLLGDANLHVFPFGLSKGRNVVEFIYSPEGSVWSSASYESIAAWPAGGDLKERMKNAILLSLDRNKGNYPVLRWIPAFLRPLLLDFWISLRMRKVAQTARKVYCEVRTLSEVIREQDIQRIDLLKIDVEGAEFEVLAGIDDADWLKVRQIVAEVEHYAKQSEPFAELLKRHDFKEVSMEQSIPQAALDIGTIYARRGSAP